MVIVPLRLDELNALVARLHRHHKPVQGHRFSLGAVKDGKLVGGCSVGRPVARMVDQWAVLEVTRLVTDGTPNACSALYAAAARAGKAMGYQKIQTYILEDEPGVTLKAAGWSLVARTAGGDNWIKSRPGRRDDQPFCPKQRWEKTLSAEGGEARAFLSRFSDWL